jgi:hypothetical protein
MITWEVVCFEQRVLDENIASAVRNYIFLPRKDEMVRTARAFALQHAGSGGLSGNLCCIVVYESTEGCLQQ